MSRPAAAPRGALPRAAPPARVVWSGSRRARQPCPISASASARRALVEREVEREHVDPRLAENPSCRSSTCCVHQLAHTLLRQAARLGDARHLEQRGLRRDVRDRGRCRRWSRGRSARPRTDSRPCSASDVALDPLDQRLVGRPEVRAAGVRGVVGRRHGLGRIVRVGCGRGRRPAVEVARRSVKAWPISAEPIDLAVLLDQAAVRLTREEQRRRGRSSRADRRGR